MAYTVRVTEDNDLITAKKGDRTLAELANDLNLESADISAAIGAYLAALPTADPLEDDAFWLNSGVVTISAGGA